MKIKLDMVKIICEERDIEFPVYIQQAADYYCFFDPEDYKKNIRLTDMSIGKSIDYFTDLYTLIKIFEMPYVTEITKEVFQNKLVEILSIINGAVDEMHKINQQQQNSQV